MLALALLLAPTASAWAQAAQPPPLFPLELRQLVELDSGPAAPPIVAADTVILLLRTGALVAVDLNTGRVAWQRAIETDAPPSPAGALVLIATSEALEALDAATGEMVWRAPLAHAPVSPVLVVADLGLLALASGELTAFTLQNGAPRWTASLGGRPGGVLAVAGSRVVAGLEDGRLIAFDAATGTVHWQQRLGATVTGVGGDAPLLYVGALDNFLYALEARDGRIRWRWRTGGDIVGTAAVDRYRVYFVSLDNLVRALDRRSGVQRWKKPLLARPIAGPLLIGPTLLLAGVSPELRAIHADTGEPAGRYDMGSDLGAAPVFRPGRWALEDLLVAATREGSLVVLGRRVSPGVVPLAALPGTPVDVTVPSPPE